MEFFYVFPTRKIHLRELSRELKLSMPTILRAVKSLVHERMLLMNRGRAVTTIEANTQNQQFSQLKRINNLERLYTSGLVSKISETCRPQVIVCFGSYARGEDFEDSDIDLAIVGGSGVLPVEKYEKFFKRRVSLHHINLKEVTAEFKASLYNGIVLEGAL